MSRAGLHPRAWNMLHRRNDLVLVNISVASKKAALSRFDCVVGGPVEDEKISVKTGRCCRRERKMEAIEEDRAKTLRR